VRATAATRSRRRLSTLRYQGGLFGRYGAAAKAPRSSDSTGLPDRGSRNGDRGWLERDLEFKDFAASLEFVNRVAEIAEELNHHPNILLHGWNRVRVASWSHDVKGITDRDYVLAGRINTLING
jgi:4a-hydroxytetrahydrobiopterin dehydratase